MHNIHFKRPEEILLNDLILFIFGDGNTFYFCFQKKKKERKYGPFREKKIIQNSNSVESVPKMG